MKCAACVDQRRGSSGRNRPSFAATAAQPKQGAEQMNTITTKDGAQIYFKDWGPEKAQPIVFHHGWPLSGDDWDTQMLYFLGQGYRVIAIDRRGHGRSSQIATGHDMDHYAADAAEIGRASGRESGEGLVRGVE